MLRATNLSVRLGKSLVLKDIDFSALPGQATAIVGPNGSGKTTLLRAMTGDVPCRGTVTLNGRDINTLRPWELAEMRAVLPQASALAFPFTVVEVVQIGLLRGRSGASSQIPMKALARVGLAGHANRYYQELSGGEQQRVHLARVLAQVWEPLAGGVPRWLFLDEPVSALDIAQQLQVLEIARGFARAGGGVVAVMHDLNLTAMFADKVVLLADGEVAAEGSPAEVMTDATLSQVYGVDVRVGRVPPPGTPFLLPHGSAGRLPH